MGKKNNYIIALIFGALAFVSFVNANAVTDDALQKIDISFYKTNPYDIVYGKEDAPIQVLEYYAVSCTHCAYFYLNVFPPLKQKYIDDGRVRWIKRSYVVDQASMQGSLFLNCFDGDQRKNYLKILLAKQSNWIFAKDDARKTLGNIARLGGMSQQTFQQCMNNKETEHQIRVVTNQAIKVAKISGTPTLYVNQERILNFSEQSFAESFNAILAK